MKACIYSVKILRKLLESDDIVLKLLQRNLYKDLYFYSVGSTTVVH